MLIVTIAALVMAASLGWFAYRLLQEEHRRSEARVALLTAALEGDPATQEFEVAPARVAPARVVPPPVAPAPRSAFRTAPTAPRIVMLDDDARPMQAFTSERVLATAVPSGETPVPDLLQAPLRDLPAHPEDHSTETPASASGLFADVPQSRPADARGLIALAGVVLVGLLAIGYVFFGRPGSPADAAGTAAAPGPALAGQPRTTPAGMPLELLSLTHEQRSGTLVVRGLVRNPPSGSDRAGLVASVMLLDQAGGVLGSGRAPIDTSRLRPGDDAGFSVKVPSHKDVRRYRVTFRTSDDVLVAHTDKRGGE